MRTPMKAKARTIWIMAPALAMSIGFLVPNAAAQSDPYPKMAPVDQYLMEKNAEIQLAGSAAPDSISRDATILVLGRQGYETAVEGKNGFARRPTELRLGNPSSLPSELSAIRKVGSDRVTSRP